MEGVRQDYGAMYQIADDMQNKAQDYWKLKEELYQEFTTQLNDSDAAAWSGNRASVLLDKLKKQEPEFESIRGLIESLADNLNLQAKNWDNFENRA